MWSRYWWLVVVRGMIALVVGLAAVFVPIISVMTLITVLSVFLIVDGVVLMGAGLRQGTQSHYWWALVLQGIVGIVAGTLGLLAPRMTALAFAIIVGVWSVVGGVFEIVYAIRMRRELTNEWLCAAAGLLSAVVGALLLAYPSSSLIVLAIGLGAYTLVSGAILLTLGVRLRSEARRDFWSHIDEAHSGRMSGATV